MKKKSRTWLGIRVSREQKKVLQIMMLPMIVLILIIIIKIAERPKKEPELPSEPTVAMTESGMTAENIVESWEEERLPEEPGDEPDETEPTEPETETEPLGQDEFATDRFQRDPIPEILTLMEHYFQAKEKGDAAAMNQLYGIGEVTEEELQAQSARMRSNSKYVQGFENVATYVMDGPEEGSWLVYAVVDINFYLARTRAPMITWCYVKQDGEGNFLIVDNQKLSPEIQRFIVEAGRLEEVRRLAANVNQRLREALNADEDLKNVYGILREGSPVWEETEETQPEISIIGTESAESTMEETLGE
ncbi:MAG: hypothetical protein HFI97_00315 [Lachnospiraceae bacterium]|nr:hypothetical protein [Lachnospiraceae bacterium]MCI9560264.1 hypothetical protein [Lachnospiraceae bacterium]